MKICIPTTTNIGREAEVSEHFGSAPYFTIYDTDQGVVRVVGNSNSNHSHGFCQPMEVLAGEKIEAVVCHGMGARAVQKLKMRGIKAYKSPGRTVEEVIRQFEQGKFEEITVQNACGRHHCS